MSRASTRTPAATVAALVLLASALYSTLALASFQGDPLRPEVTGGARVGPVGAIYAQFAVETIGRAAWLFPVELALLAAPLLNGRPSIFSVYRCAGDVLVPFITQGHEGFDINDPHDWMIAERLLADGTVTLPHITREPYGAVRA